MDVLTSETCWALNKEIIKQVTSSWSLFTQLSWELFSNSNTGLRIGTWNVKHGGKMKWTNWRNLGSQKKKMRMEPSMNRYSSKPYINVVLFSMFFYDRDSGDMMSREAPSTVPLLKPQKEPEWFIVCHRCLRVSRVYEARSNGVTILCAWMLWKRLEVTVTLGWWTWPNTTPSKLGGTVPLATHCGEVRGPISTVAGTIRTAVFLICSFLPIKCQKIS